MLTEVEIMLDRRDVFLVEQRTAEWFQARKGLVTASRVGAILGRSPFQTRDDVLRAMVREAHGAEREFEGNIATDWGTQMEPEALAAFQGQFPEMEVEASALFYKRGGWAGASPDGVILDASGVAREGLEIKCPYGIRNDVEPAFKTLGDQPHYYDQVQFSLWVTGCARWHFFQWTPTGSAVEHVDPSPAWVDENIPKLLEFYSSYRDARLNNYARHLQPLREEYDGPDVERALKTYDEAVAAINSATEAKQEAIERLVALTDGKDALVCGRKLTKCQREGSVSYAAVVKDYAPDVDLEAYRGKPSEYWTLR
jgi:putative phage-type endonuclease